MFYPPKLLCIMYIFPPKILILVYILLHQENLPLLMNFPPINFPQENSAKKLPLTNCPIPPPLSELTPSPYNISL